MDFIIVAFSSRTDAIKFKEIVVKKGVKAVLMPTPKEANVGCGLSVKIYYSNALFVKEVIKSTSFLSIAGVFYVSVRGGHSFIRIIK
jgi:hypothetical protein